MRLMHIGLACRSERDADRFFNELLGLAKQEPKTVPASVVQPLFGVDDSITIVNYLGNGLHVEVFLAGSRRGPSDRVSHVCLEVENAGTLLDRAAVLGFAVTRVPKGNGWVLFLDDSDGHRFEIKEAGIGA